MNGLFGKCKVCGKAKHWCHSCGYDEDVHPMSEGYCSWECLRKDNGPEYNSNFYDDEGDK